MTVIWVVRLDPIAPICSRRAQLLLQGELNCEAARQEGKVEEAATAGVNLKQAGANTNIHAVVMLIIAQNTVIYHIRHYIRARV